MLLILAAGALAFEVPSLILAGVPPERWPEHIVLAGAGAALVLGTMLSQHSQLWVRLVKGLIVGIVIGGVGWVGRGHFDQTPLLFAMLVAGMAVLQGLGPALICAAVGAVVMPGVIQAELTTNVTDHVYAGIYLFGAAVLPWSAVRVAQRRANATEGQLDATTAMQREAVLILARAAEAKDEFTGDHVAQVGDLSKELAVAIGMPRPEVEGLRYAAMLHDVGKLHVPDRILLKPGPLSPAEWEVIRRHTTLGAKILGDSVGFALARTVARSHHENWDGSGYPDGLSALDIPLAARVVRLVDVFDALRSQRPYKPAWSFERCLDELVAGTGRHFDPELVPVFVGLLDRLYAEKRLVMAESQPTEAAA
jgi:hypothetical protein